MPTSLAENRPEDSAWTDGDLANPHAIADKARRVQRMFSAIAPSYDLNNRVHSLGMDQAWRRKAVRMAAVKPTDLVVDIACGTGDLSVAFLMAGPKAVIGIDFCHAMLVKAHQKAAELNPSQRAGLEYCDGDAMRLPLTDASVDIVSIAFGIRNVSDFRLALREFARVLRPGGRLIILEFSLPENPILRGMYNFYFRRILPISATIISGDRTGAYRYLPESVNTFIGREELVSAMAAAGFDQPVATPLTMGISVCYRGVRCG